MSGPAFICVLDFEATCDNETKMENEIIEFPSVLLRRRRKAYTIVSEFQRFCKPRDNPTLTPFCTELTGTTQTQVDSGDDFPTVLKDHYSWLIRHCTSSDEEESSSTSAPAEESTEESTNATGPLDIAFVTCGAWDLKTMLPKECERWGIAADALPDEYKSFINVKKVFQSIHKSKKARGMDGMLKSLNLPLVGRHHSGIDDCRNITTIWQVLCRQGYEPNRAKDAETVRYP